VARDRATKLEPKLSKLTIQVQSTATGQRVSKDAVEISAAEWGTAVPTGPGDHVVEATAPGKKRGDRRPSSPPAAPRWS
jgi:hypothetical protein